MKKVILNQKSYLLYDEICDYKKELDKLKTKDYEIILFPCIEYLSMFNNSKFAIGTQNFFSVKTGSYTGEVNLESLKDMNIKYSLINHFERRKIIGESKEIIKEKLYKSLSYSFNTILCVGEDNKLKKSISFIKKELKYYLRSIESSSLKHLSVCYIPSHALSVSDKNIDSIKKVIMFIKDYFKKKYNLNIDVYYGGFIENCNIKEIYDLCDGIILDNQSNDIKMVKELLKEL